MKKFHEILDYQIEGYESEIIKILKAKGIEAHFSTDILFIKNLDNLPITKKILTKSSKIKELPVIKHGQKR